MKRIVGLGLATLAGAVFLTGCPAVLGTGAVVAGISALDRRTVGSQVEDQSIEVRASQRFEEALGKRGHINVTSFNRMVLLSGEVGSEADRETAERLVREQRMVREVFNELAVAPFTSTITERSKDSLLTTQVKASLANAPDIAATAFKVVTERRVVFLMGLVTEREARRAAEIARGINGVEKVVRLFEVVSEDDLVRQRPPQQPSGQEGIAVERY